MWCCVEKKKNYRQFGLEKTEISFRPTQPTGCKLKDNTLQPIVIARPPSWAIISITNLQMGFVYKWVLCLLIIFNVLCLEVTWPRNWLKSVLCYILKKHKHFVIIQWSRYHGHPQRHPITYMKTKFTNLLQLSFEETALLLIICKKEHKKKLPSKGYSLPLPLCASFYSSHLCDALRGALESIIVMYKLFRLHFVLPNQINQILVIFVRHNSGKRRRFQRISIS